MSIEKAKQRLDSFESRDASGIGNHAAALADLLGKVDSLFWPFRYSLERGNPAAIEDRRQLYFKRGIEWSGTNSGDELSTKANERQRRSMSRAGLIRCRSAKAKAAVFVRFADGVEDTTRRLLGLRQLSDCRLALAMLITKFNESHGWCRRGGWVAECRLFDSDYTERPKGSNWWADFDSLLPLLTAGVVESRSSTVGHVFFRPTGVELPESTGFDANTEHDDSLFKVYEDSFHTGLHDREHWTHDSAEIFIPLSATR